MEFGISSRESSPGQKSSSEKKKDSESSTDTKKKSTGSAAIQAEIAVERKVENQQRQGQVVESLWQKINGDSAMNKPPEMPLFGIKRPEADDKNDTPTHKFGEPTVIKPDVVETDFKQDETTISSELAETNDEDQAELVHAAQEFTEVRLQAADGELHELPLDQYGTPRAAEAAAGAALMRAVQETLQQDSSRPIAESLEAAERSVEETMNIEPNPEDLENQEVSDVSEAEAETEPLSDTEPTLDFTPPGEVYGDLPPMPPPIVPPRPPHGPPPGPPAGPPQGPGFGTMPLPGGMPGGHGFGVPNMLPNVMPNVAPVVQVVESRGNEQAAMSQGLLIGGIVGYFVGRRRGRKQGKNKAEKQFVPVQRTLERKVKSLQDTITAKEQQIRQVAREKISAVTRPQDRQRFVDKLRSPAVETVAVAAIDNGERVAVPYRPEQAPPVFGLPAAEQTPRSTEAERAPNASMDLGRLLVEAPLALVAAPAVVERLRSERAAEVSKVVPFDKKAENFSHEELMNVAEKIKVQGVSLKEMVELGSLDERALCRVTQEFLEGGSVSAAVSREVKEKELKYERDPRMRNAVAGQPGGSVAGVAGAAIGQVTGAGGSGAADAARSGSTSGYDGQRPTPDEATLKAIRDKQLVTVGTTTVVTVLIILIALLLTR